MLQTEISHMFDNSLYSKRNIHRKLQQALAQLLRKLEMQRESLQCFHFKDKEQRRAILFAENLRNILTKKNASPHKKNILVSLLNKRFVVHN